MIKCKSSPLDTIKHDEIHSDARRYNEICIDISKYSKSCEINEYN